MTFQSSHITKIRAGIIILALILCSMVSVAQDTVSKPSFTISRKSVQLPNMPDSLRHHAPAAPVAALPADTVASSTKEHSPTTALLLSLLPGAGQWYNGQAWKIPVIYTGFGVLGYFIYDYYSNMALFRDDYLSRINGNGTTIPEYASYPNESIYNMYQSYNKNFQLLVIVSVGVYALNLVDAYVFGHLYDFQINDDLSLHVQPLIAPSLGNQPYTLNYTPSLRVSLKF